MQRSNVIALEPYILARNGGRAERARDFAKVRVIEDRLRQLVGHPTPDALCDIWWQAAGHGEPEETYVLAPDLDPAALAAYLAEPEVTP